MRSQAEQRWNELREDWLAEAFDPALRIGVLAAHPDDETIGASALLARCGKPTVICLTDGAPRNADLWPPHFHGSREEYAHCRQHEAEAALAHAGISPREIVWLGGVDQEAIVKVAELSERLASVADSRKLDLLITHSYEGGHPDHDAAALIASIAISRCAGRTLHLEMTSYHVHGGKCETGVFLNGNSGMEFTFRLSEQDKARKERMLRAYSSQKLVLENFSADYERLRLAPVYDFAAPPHEGKLWYEVLGWRMTGARWREFAIAALHPVLEIHVADRA